MTTLPGLLFIDWYDSAIGQLYGVDATVAVNERMSHDVGCRRLRPPRASSASCSRCRWRRSRCGGPGWCAGGPRWRCWPGTRRSCCPNVLWWGCAITTVCFAVFSLALARPPARRRR